MKTLIWKEWREQRLFFFLAVGLTILGWVTLFFIPKERMRDYGEAMAIFIFIILPILFSLFLGTASFTNEFVRNTKNFLLAQPLSSARLFWTKFFYGLALLFILIVITYLAFMIPEVRFFAHKNTYGSVFPFLLSLIVLYSAACFSSLLLKNNLPAIICTPFILLFGILLVLPLAVVLFIAYPYPEIFIFSIVSTLTTVFIILSFFAWQKAIVKDISPAKIIIITTVVILFVSFGIHAVSNLTVSRKLNKIIQQAKAKGIKLTPQEVIPPPVPDKDNAALVYQQAFDLADKLEAKHKQEWDYIRNIPLEQLTLMQKSAISGFVKDPEFTNLYALIEKAVNLPSCRFDIKYEDSPAINLSPHLEGVFTLERLVAVHTYILIQGGRYKEALKSAQTGLHLGDSLVEEPLLFSQAVRPQLDGIAMKSIRSLLDIPQSAISVRDYRELILDIDKKDKQINKGWERELAIYSTYAFKRYSGTSYDNNRFFGMREKLPFWGTLIEPVTTNDYGFFLEKLSTWIALSRKPYYFIRGNVARELQKDITDFAINNRYVKSGLLQALGGNLQEQAIYAANLDSFKLVLALKIYKQKYNNYPDMLLSLSPKVIPQLPLDPFTGKDYIYRKEGKGFILYSVGKNGRNNNGVYDQKQLGKYDDITWKGSN